MSHQMLDQVLKMTVVNKLDYLINEFYNLSQNSLSKDILDTEILKLTNNINDTINTLKTNINSVLKSVYDKELKPVVIKPTEWTEDLTFTLHDEVFKQGSIIQNMITPESETVQNNDYNISHFGVRILDTSEVGSVTYKAKIQPTTNIYFTLIIENEVKDL